MLEQCERWKQCLQAVYSAVLASYLMVFVLFFFRQYFSCKTMPIIVKLRIFLLIILDFDVVLIFLKPQTSICLKNFSLATRAFSNSETAKLSCWQRRQEASDSFAQYCSPWPSCPWPPCLPLHHPPLTTIYLNRIGLIETSADGDNLVFLLIINKGSRSRAHLKACISLNVGDPRCLRS